MSVQVSARLAEHLYRLAVGGAAGHRRRPLHLVARVDPAGMHPVVDLLGGLRVDISLANDAAEGCRDMAGRTAETIIKIEMPERGIEIVAPEQAPPPPAEPKAFGVGGGASQELLGFREFVDLLRRLLAVARLLLVGRLLIGVLGKARVGCDQ